MFGVQCINNKCFPYINNLLRGRDSVLSKRQSLKQANKKLKTTFDLEWELVPWLL